MKTIRLLYPDALGGGLSTYRLGARLMERILPDNPSQPVMEVPCAPEDGRPRPVTDGIYAREEVTASLRAAQAILADAAPDRVITIGGSCLVSFPSFDYLHGKYPDAGLLWIDAHPDVSTAASGYPNAHAMVLGALLGGGEPALEALRRHPPFAPDRLLYVGLQGLHDYQKAFLDEKGAACTVQTERFVSADAVRAFASRFPQVFVHLDVDVLDPAFFHDTYFANPALTGDGSGGGRMTLDELSAFLGVIAESAPIAGFTIAEYLPFAAERLARMFAAVPLFTDR